MVPPTRVEIPADFRRRYEVRARLGQGAYAVVARALQRSLDRPVIAKLFFPHVAGRGAAAARVLQEARILAGIRDPHVVPLLDHGSCEGMIYLVYPDEGAAALVDHPERERWSEEGALRELLDDLLRGLEVVHRAGIVHRDVKPANVVITADGRAQLIDFGLARDLEGGPRFTRTDLFVGTPSYASPAQILGLPPEPRDDLYSLGVLAYELATGARPFEASSGFEVMELHLNRVPPDPRVAAPGLSPALARWILGLLEKDRDDRPDSAADARASLAASARRPVPRPGGTARFPRSSRAGTIAAQRASARPPSPRGPALVLLLALLVAGGLRTGDPAPPPRLPDTPARPGTGAAIADAATRALARWSPPPGGATPLDWEPTWAALPALDPWRRWRAEGLPGATAADRAALQEADREFESLGLGRPFHPAAYVAPRAAALRLPAWLLPALSPEARALPWPREFSGWGAASLLELGRSHAALAEVRAALAAVARGERELGELLPVDGRSFPIHRWLTTGASRGPDDARVILSGYVVIPGRLAQAVEYLRVPVRHAARALWAAARALDADPLAGGWAALACAEVLRDAHELWIGGLGVLRAETLLGDRAPSPEATWLRGLHALRAAQSLFNLTEYGGRRVPDLLRGPSPDLPGEVGAAARSEGDRPWSDLLRRRIREDLGRYLDG